MKNASASVFVVLLLIVSAMLYACQSPHGCPTCVGSNKPACYNKATAKAMKRTAHQNKNKGKIDNHMRPSVTSGSEE
jgi:hypothetical protein